mmetsp:Transcript_21139/g.64389  ORF Transcript_21139/g.64389 Transcript_21139/m.64389 type:complete len:332 (+) Transcript_21139:1202-2197(+)
MDYLFIIHKTSFTPAGGRSSLALGWAAGAGIISHTRHECRITHSTSSHPPRLRYLAVFAALAYFFTLTRVHTATRTHTCHHTQPGRSLHPYPRSQTLSTLSQASRFLVGVEDVQAAGEVEAAVLRAAHDDLRELVLVSGLDEEGEVHGDVHELRLHGPECLAADDAEVVHVGVVLHVPRPADELGVSPDEHRLPVELGDLPREGAEARAHVVPVLDDADGLEALHPLVRAFRVLAPALEAPQAGNHGRLALERRHGLGLDGEPHGEARRGPVPRRREHGRRLLGQLDVHDEERRHVLVPRVPDRPVRQLHFRRDVVAAVGRADHVDLDALV